MPTKKRQTMQKVARERDQREKRALKQEKKDAKKAAAAAGEDVVQTDLPEEPAEPGD